MSDITTDELRRIVAFILKEMERNAGFTDCRYRDEALLFGIALRSGAVPEWDGSKLRERR